jgi:heat shock protein HslJ
MVPSRRPGLGDDDLRREALGACAKVIERFDERGDMRKRWIAIGLVGLSAAVLAACGSSDDDVEASAASDGPPLEGTNWILSDSTDLGVSLDGVTVSARFEEGTVAGTSGCNSYTGPYEVDGEDLTIGPEIASTQMACEEPQSAVEQAYLAALPDVASFAVADDQLTLSNGDGDAVLVYDATNGAEAIVGSWIVTSYYSGNAITSVLGDATLTADFADDGTLSGNAGCNNYNGPYEIDGDSISIGPLAGTKMACTSEELSKQEADYLAALELAQSFTVTGNRLDLLREGGTIAATLEKA